MGRGSIHLIIYTIYKDGLESNSMEYHIFHAYILDRWSGYSYYTHSERKLEQPFMDIHTNFLDTRIFLVARCANRTIWRV